MTEETKKKLSQALKGRKLTEEHKRNISKAKKGVKFTEDHILKIKEAQRLRQAKVRSRAIWSIRARIQLPEYYSNST